MHKRFVEKYNSVETYTAVRLYKKIKLKKPNTQICRIKTIYLNLIVKRLIW